MSWVRRRAGDERGAAVQCPVRERQPKAGVGHEVVGDLVAVALDRVAAVVGWSREARYQPELHHRLPLSMDLLRPFLGNGAGPAPAVAAPGTAVAASGTAGRPLGQ